MIYLASSMLLLIFQYLLSPLGHLARSNEWTISQRIISQRRNRSVENPTAATAGRAADAMAARQWRCSPRFRADAHKYTITYELCSIRMVRTKNCARRTSHGLAPPSSARNSRAPLAAGFEEGQAAAAVVQVCHAGSAAAPNTCTMSHHVQDGGQQAAAAGVQVCHAGSAAAPTTCTMSHHLQGGGQHPKSLRFTASQVQLLHPP